ncbi:hypothetical protein M3226_29350 [Neobacillus cucumis]|uniref:hypothetical protein n=1 Tax=Neobacillus cucumis TaxID=1740721 RepID=UPI00203FF2B1|nr:hypothetical protein [Neobacillus cucumis]MCM3729678.1 hypothetical protein [Neobacillus cucumis]
MNKEKMIADELQHMFLEGKLKGFKEEYINFITRKLRTGDTSIDQLIQEDSELKEKVLEASEHVWNPEMNDKNHYNKIPGNLKGMHH